MKRLMIPAGAAIVLLAVGGPAAVASYQHAEKVARDYGEESMAAWLPLTTDGMLVAALVLMYWRRFIGEPVGRFPWFAFGAGMLATLGANLASADISFGGIAVALWPPVCFAITLEIGAMMLKYIPKTLNQEPEEPEETPEVEPEETPEETPEVPNIPLPRPPADTMSRRQKAIAWSVDHWPVTGPQIAKEFGYSDPTAYVIRKVAMDQVKQVNGHKVK